MNYYPNYLPQNQTFAQPNPSFLQQNQTYTPPIPTLNGKIVDGIDAVKAIEVPIGSYGIYPKADLTELYVKAWNPDATTRIITYKPDIGNLKPDDESEKTDIQILNAIANLDKKLDALKPPTTKETKGGSK